MKAGLTVRPMAAEDIPGLIGMEEEGPAWSESQFTGELGQDSGVQFVAVSSAVCGYLCGRAVLDEAEIVKIAVKRGARRQGTATLLLKYFLDALFQKGVRTCHLEVRRSNIPARNFYEKNGFSVMGVRKDYYSFPREDAVMMTKVLP